MAKLPEKATDRDYLVAIYAKLDTQNKVLCAVVAAIVGSRFIPQSPVDLAGAAVNGAGFLAILGAAYLVSTRFHR